MAAKNNSILAFGTALAFVLSQGGAVYGSTGYSKVWVIPSKRNNGSCRIYTFRYDIFRESNRKRRDNNGKVEDFRSRS